MVDAAALLGIWGTYRLIILSGAKIKFSRHNNIRINHGFHRPLWYADMFLKIPDRVAA